MTPPDTATTSSPGPTVKILSVEDSLPGCISDAKAAGADIIILLSHVSRVPNRTAAHTAHAPHPHQNLNACRPPPALASTTPPLGCGQAAADAASIWLLEHAILAQPGHSSCTASSTLPALQIGYYNDLKVAADAANFDIDIIIGAWGRAPGIAWFLSALRFAALCCGARMPSVCWLCLCGICIGTGTMPASRQLSHLLCSLLLSTTPQANHPALLPPPSDWCRRPLPHLPQRRTSARWPAPGARPR